MKIKVIHTTLAAAAFAAATLFTACNKEASDGAAATESPAPAPVRAEPDASLPELKVEITANDQMKFSVVAIEAKPRQKVTVTLKNVGTMPKMSMGHNFVLLANDMDPAKFIEASMTKMGNDFVAPELEAKVIAHTKLLGPGESGTISFAAPQEPGAYNYVCSFPGHFAIGMKGVLTVK